MLSPQGHRRWSCIRWADIRVRPFYFGRLNSYRDKFQSIQSRAANREQPRYSTPQLRQRIRDDGIASGHVVEGATGVD